MGNAHGTVTYVFDVNEIDADVNDDDAADDVLGGDVLLWTSREPQWFATVDAVCAAAPFLPLQKNIRPYNPIGAQYGQP